MTHLVVDGAHRELHELRGSVEARERTSHDDARVRDPPLGGGATEPHLGKGAALHRRQPRDRFVLGERPARDGASPSTIGSEGDELGGAGFTARGSDAGEGRESSYVVVHRSGNDAGPSRAGDSIRRGDELTFAYGNASNKPFLLVYGVDERRHVFWYYPAWTDAQDDPRSIAIQPGAHALPDAIRHDLVGSTLEIHAVFTDAPLRVNTVEDLISRAPAGRSPSFGPGSIDRSIRFQVQP